MKKQFVKIEAGGETFDACWDMTAWATFERLSNQGKSASEHVSAFAGFKLTADNALAALWAAIDAAAAHHDKEAPISLRRLGTLFTTTDDMGRAFNLVGKLLEAFVPERKANAGKGESAANSSPSQDAISSQPLTSELASASSGV